MLRGVLSPGLVAFMLLAAISTNVCVVLAFAASVGPFGFDVLWFLRLLHYTASTHFERGKTSSAPMPVSIRGCDCGGITILYFIRF